MPVNDLFSQSAPWSSKRTVVKDVVAEAWAGVAEPLRPTRRRRRTRATPVNLQQQMRDYPLKIDLLVAEAIWGAEMKRAKDEK